MISCRAFAFEFFIFNNFVKNSILIIFLDFKEAIFRLKIKSMRMRENQNRYTLDFLSNFKFLRVVFSSNNFIEKKKFIEFFMIFFRIFVPEEEEEKKLTKDCESDNGER